MVKFNSVLHKFEEKGDKTGWTYIEIPRDIAEQVNPGVKKSFRVKGSIDKHQIQRVAVLPMGGGTFIVPVNSEMRKGIAKKEGAMVTVSLTVDHSVYELNRMLVDGIEASPAASKAFYKMPLSHRNYYSKWIDSAKTLATQEKRVVLAVLSLESGKSYGEMLREQSAVNKM